MKRKAGTARVEPVDSEERRALTTVTPDDEAGKPALAEEPRGGGSRILAWVGPRPDGERASRSDAPLTGPEEAPTGSAPAQGTRSALPTPTPAQTAERATPTAETGAPLEIQRFRKAEIALHWSIAAPFMACFITGLIVKLFLNSLHPEAAAWIALLWVHRVAGVGFVVLPAWSMWRYRRDLAVHSYNIRRAWTWARDDVKWLFLAVAAAAGRKVALPEQHKFNAGEKLNFMMVMATYPVLALTGLILLVPGIQFVSFIVHVAVALTVAPLAIGHIFMALVNPSTRVGLSGMVTGYVDRDWARHHYGKWYREAHVDTGQADAGGREVEETSPAPVVVRCTSCQTEHALDSLQPVLASVAELRPLACPICRASAAAVSVSVAEADLGAILQRLERAGGSLQPDEPKSALSAPRGAESGRALTSASPDSRVIVLGRSADLLGAG